MRNQSDRVVEFTGPRAVRVVEVDRPEPGPDEVIVETHHSAVSSGTELLVYRGEVDASTVADETLPALDGRLSYPVRYGYAAVGTVIDIGDRVDPAWRGRTVFGYHPHRSAFVAAPDDLVAVPDDVDRETAALLASAETAVTFALDGAPALGERVAVFGQGVVGLLTTAALATTGVETVVAVEPIAYRRELAATMGADVTVDPDRRDPVAAIREATDGVDLAVEVSGRPATLEAAIESTRYAGRVVVGSWYGTRREAIGLGAHFHRRRVRVRSSQVSTIDPPLRGRWDRDRRHDVALSHLAATDVSDLITHRVPVDDAPAVYEHLDARPIDARTADAKSSTAVQVLFTYE